MRGWSAYIVSALLFCIIASTPLTSLAADPLSRTAPPSAITLGINAIPRQGPTSVTTFYAIFQNVVGWVFIAAIILGVLMLIIAGIMYMTAGGDQAKASKAMKILVYTFIGVAVAALAWALVNVIGNYFVGARLIGGGGGGGYVSCPGITPNPNGTEVTVLLIGGNCFAISQFSVSPGETICVVPHYHASVAVVSLDGSTVLNDPNPGGCGFGKVSDVTIGTIRY